ncbi:MAG TPA: Gfo/Idh/MocA family oxidoreductase [Chthonomonadales bacterium]|nr:Gfo/Idh/MocA family oxidoreductase [Chthonomonadales bacterium]
MPQLNVAIIGCGLISGQHIRALRNCAERARISVCCDPDKEKADRAADLAGAENHARAVQDYEAVLQCDEVDAVCLLLPHHLHAQASIQAALAGKHILCEKPLALTPSEIDEMADAASRNGVVLYHGENMRLSLAAELAAAIVKEGRLGTVVGVQGTYAHWQWEAYNRDWRTRKEEAGGGHLIDGAIHYVDMLRHIGGDISAVHAMMAQYRPELGAEAEDTGVLNLRYSAGHLGQLFASHASRGRAASSAVSVFGTEGCLSLDAYGQNRGLVYFPHGAEPEVIVQQQAWADTFDRQASHFLDVVLDGAPLKAIPHDARENLKVVLAAYQSAASGREQPT